MPLPWGASITQSARRACKVMLAPALLLGLAGCSDAPGETPTGPPPNPPVYEIAGSDGAVEGWMVGTIHALPDDVEWKTPAITKAVAEADLLVVEIARLGDSAPTFSALSTTAGLPPLDQRVPQDMRPQLAELLERGDLDTDKFANTETWAAAIILAQIDAPGDPDNGVDRALTDDFAGRPVRELEGVRAQLSIFDRLPEAEQRDMLTAVIREAQGAQQDPARLQRAWLAGDAQAITAATSSGILADPELRAALLTTRNRRWIAALLPMLEQPTRPLIAVGAAHLVGPEGLAALIEAEGYTVRRVR